MCVRIRRAPGYVHDPFFGVFHKVAPPERLIRTSEFEGVPDRILLALGMEEGKIEIRERFTELPDEIQNYGGRPGDTKTGRCPNLTCVCRADLQWKGWIRPRDRHHPTTA